MDNVEHWYLECFSSRYSYRRRMYKVTYLYLGIHLKRCRYIQVEKKSVVWSAEVSRRGGWGRRYRFFSLIVQYLQCIYVLLLLCWRRYLYKWSFISYLLFTLSVFPTRAKEESSLMFNDVENMVICKRSGKLVFLRSMMGFWGFVSCILVYRAKLRLRFSYLEHINTFSVKSNSRSERFCDRYD